MTTDDERPDDERSDAAATGDARPGTGRARHAQRARARARVPTESTTGGGSEARTVGSRGAPRLPRRAAAIVGVVALLAGMGVCDRLVARGSPPRVASLTALDAVGVAPPGAESSSWYCAGGTGAQGGAPMSLLLTNATTHPVQGTVTAIPASAATASTPAPWSGAVTIPVSVPAAGELGISPAQLGSASIMAAAVVLDGGGVSVAQSVSSPLGWSMAPCAATASPDWYFAHGATTQGGGLILALFNPGATDAAVNVSLFSSTAGYLAPAAYQGIDVPPGSLVTENLGDHAADDASLGTAVSALTGTVVATELESVGSPGAGGISLTLGSPALSPVWSFPQNATGGGSKVVFHVLDPSAHPATVSVAIGLTAGANAEPLSLEVPAQGQATLDTSTQIRLPSSAAYALTFTSHGAGIVVTRQVSAPGGLPAPAPEDGDVVGVPGAGMRWLVPTVMGPGTGAWALAIIDEGHAPATVRITSPTGTPAPGGRARIQPGVPFIIGPSPGPPYGTGPLVVRASQPVAVELDALPVAAGPGVVVVPAFALP